MPEQDFTRESILSQMGLASGPLFCPRPRTLYLGHRGKAKSRQAVRVGCDAWRCPACGPYKRLTLGYHLACRFLSASIAEEYVKPSKWEYRRKQFQGKGVGYARILAESGGWWLLHNAEDAPCPSVFPSCEDAIRRLGERLLALPLGHLAAGARPVSTSRNWSLRKPKGEYRLLGLLPIANPDRIRNPLKTAGVDVKTFDRDDGQEWRLSWAVPDGCELVFRNGELQLVQQIAPDDFQNSVWGDYI